MTNIVDMFQFKKKQEAAPLLNMDPEVLMEGLFDCEENFELLGIACSDVMELAGSLEIYGDSRYPDKMLVDLDNTSTRENIRGLYEIEPKTYKLIRIADEPLNFFL